MLKTIINYWIEILPTSIICLIIYIFKSYIGLKNRLKSLLKNDIVRIYETFSSIGYCANYMKGNIR